MAKPYADDWKVVSKGVEKSKSLGLYFKDGKVYDERSASHNGIIGLGVTLREIVENSRKRGELK